MKVRLLALILMGLCEKILEAIARCLADLTKLHSSGGEDAAATNAACDLKSLRYIPHPIPHNLFAINSTTYRKENRADVRQLVEQKTDMVAAWCSDYNFFDTSRSIFVEQLPSNEYLQVVAASFPVLRFDSSTEVKWSSRSDRPFF
ncbi:hypothetical protein GNF10_13045 [Nostoc sp. UCD121]|uniref:hypothetical protein n=1 Tax=unclassified Nostoc TaxID=2593658 RepID=UPI001627AA9A|nr:MULTISPECIES: hypothetical protein [unclassified Nostoc]MBC1221225.1 hypothetical protein [Nostoc sp. UCD120]MBC1276867.1 hypothetical protein [Nostoc sp. UCD121]